MKTRTLQDIALAIACCCITTPALASGTPATRVLTAGYALPGHHRVDLSIDPAGVVRENFTYGKAHALGRKHVTYWIKGDTVISRFSEPGDTEARAHRVTLARPHAADPTIGDIRITPTQRHVELFGQQGREYRISARIDGQMRSWTAVLAGGPNGDRLRQALRQALTGVGDLLPSHELAATLRAIEGDPQLRHMAPLAIGGTFRLVALKSQHASQIQLPSIPIHEENTPRA
ncbi:hypothetical protein [Acidihalobacter prosperus]|uniref:DUF3108 domain-containing protein n=1 Tax=Acidihalobacter prosperus TaxID=160660 RepID=A0A1A6C4N4_9GAMM|nr:hypothetical protein [Acidihalobacter prosperus]OBS09514.1 hypothetical protein Thpro_021842 [Acidihalobacter prosperus]